MRSYGQFCPIARASEILSERWTLIILRNLLYGCTTFGQLAEGAPASPARCSPSGCTSWSGPR